MVASLYVAALLLALAVGAIATAMETRSRRRVRPTPADQVPPVRYLTERDAR
jgi:hypothetical protein